jgi:hypothetical protein
MRRRLAVLIAAIVLLGALVAFAVARRTGPAAQADCEKKPPPNTFAVASCDESGQPPRSPRGAAPAPR